MTALPFVKMQAQGNDFVILDGRQFVLPELSEPFIRRIAERRYGVGCDQLLVMMADEVADCRLRIFNNDGSEAENCGNGLRCIGKILLKDDNIPSCNIKINGRKILAENGDYGIRVHMGAAIIADRSEAHVDVNLGNPHRVFFETTEDFPIDRNVEIVSGKINNDVYIDIIERGAGRTPSCGTGACAVTAAIWSTEKHQHPLTIHMPGGRAYISGTPDNLILEGEVRHVFSGQYALPKADDPVPL